MTRRSITLVAALVVAAFGVWIYNRLHGSFARRPPTPVAHAARPAGRSHESAATPTTPSIRTSTEPRAATHGHGFRQEKYNELRKKFGAPLGTGYGPMDARNLASIAESIRLRLRNQSMWPIVKDVLYGNTVALENALDRGFNPNSVVEKGRGNVESLLDMAIDAGQRGAIKALVAHGADVNVDQYDLGKYGASTQDATYVEPLVDAASSGEDDVVQYLLEHGANIDQRNNISPLIPVVGGANTALSAAVAGGGVSTVYLLLADGASVNTALDPNGYVPKYLIQIAKSNPKYAAIVKLLVNYGAEVPPSS